MNTQTQKTQTIEVEFQEDDTMTRLLSKPIDFNHLRTPARFLVTEPEMGPCQNCGRFHVLVNPGRIQRL